MQKFIKRLFCKHKNSKVICWHWTHGPSTFDIRFLEIQVKCNDCGKYHFKYIRDWNKCYEFAEKYKNKEWSNSCRPVL